MDRVISTGSDSDLVSGHFRKRYEVERVAKHRRQFHFCRCRQFLFNLIADLKSRGVPVHGIGHQMHNNVDFPSRQAIVDTINLFSSLGMDNQITELDVSIYSDSLPGPIVDYADIPVDRLIAQGYRYRTFFDAFKKLQGKISSITFWGQADDHTWLTSPARVNAPLLFDTSLRKKFAYWGLIDPLQ